MSIAARGGRAPRRRAGALAALLVALAGCASPGLRVDELQPSMFAPSLNVDLAASTRSPGGFYYRDLAVGGGEAVQRGDQVTVRYTGWLPNGSPLEPPRPEPSVVTFRVGGGQVIPGWERGVVGMHEGGRRQLVLPPALGYGPRTYGSVPPNSVLVFVIEVMEVR
ncbi:MAG TPA: FKBP-type peptidyl-prolyl cis-trans isomerase [Gemmatimonadaceae bacterium]|nr:FKBP-type peptidyl-prolyl cis-trans isomerase [Gemmatimonadaceae bacterium]